ncbi:uncharacterized protein LOC106129000 [Amyelois transitella]|uniref:uncharacterized protein LOC106129000 n=1 Tax=Amyelois transitella TaxID=680683 RepID=UPI00298FAB98|nr:uncharacterized protein LOC106129000 [Amyelois transitella]
MAPPRRILREQLKILLDFLHENRDLCTRHLASPIKFDETRQKWKTVAKKLNSVPNGSFKTAHFWRRYWIEWSNKVKTKAAQRVMMKSGEESKRILPLDKLEIRALELSGKGFIVAMLKSKNEKFPVKDTILPAEVDTASDLQPMNKIKQETSQEASSSEVQQSSRTSRLSADNAKSSSLPPPKWALELEERRIAAEERVAASLEKMASLFKAQDKRQSILEERMANALTAMAGTLQDLNCGIQEAVQHLQQTHPVQMNDRNMKDVLL